MPILNPEDFNLLREKTKPLLGVDLGDKTIGLALSDRHWQIASPLGVIERTKFTNDSLKFLALSQEHQVSGWVVGWPLNMDGTQGPRCQSTKQFVVNMLGLMDFPVLFWDERLSTVAVTNAMLEGDLSRKKRARKVDQLAATFILQGALDRLGRL